MRCKFITIGRHEYTPLQAQLLQVAGLGEEVGRLSQVDDVTQVVHLAKERGACAIVVQALPLPLLAQLLQVAGREGVRVYGFKLEAVGLYPTKEEALKKASEVGADIISPSREGSWRVVKTTALQLLKRVVVEAEDVATTPSP